MEKICLKINGKEVYAFPDQTILDVVHQEKIDTIPTLCYSPELEPYGSCFLCVVEIKGKANLVPACSTRVAPNMEVITKSERVVQGRRSALELLLSNHYADCVSPCQLSCPAHVDVQGYIALAAMGRYKEAVDLIRKTNPFPAICGRVCVRKCESVCRRKEIEEAVGINNIKRYLTDKPFVYEEVPTRRSSSGKKVAIVGAGPSGLTAAYFLGLWGHSVSIWEAMPKAGGMLRYGIPEYRLPKQILDKEIDYILRASGATLQTNARVGQHISLDDLQKNFDAVYIAAGAWASNKMRIPGEEDTKGVYLGVNFLREKTENPSSVSGTVIVVGGGNTAMDAARVSWRLGAEKVIILYRRTKTEMPADPMEVQECLNEKIEIIELAAPVAIIKREDNSLKALRCIRMILSEEDSSGRRRPVPQEGSEFDLPCDLVITAIGQQPLLKNMTQVKEEIRQTRWGTYSVDTRTMATNIKGIFAGGDVADDGPTVVIDAISDGSKAAHSIHQYLGNEALAEPLNATKELFGCPTKNELGDIKESPRHNLYDMEVAERRLNFKEVTHGYEEEDATHECERCLSCGCMASQECLLRQYATEYQVDMKHFIGYTRKQRVDDRHPYIVYDSNKCILCARCVRTCSKILHTSALGLINRGFKTEVRPAMNDPLALTNCVSCGNCVDSCPTGALSVKFPFPGRADLERTKKSTFCSFCSLECPILVHKIAEDRYFVESSPVPGEYLCRFGRFGYEIFVKQPKILKPLLLKKGHLQESSWEETCEVITHSLKQIAQKYGPESIAIFASPEATNEEVYLLSLIAREGIGTSNTGSLSLMMHGVNSHALDNSFGFTGSTAGIEALQNADLIVCNNVDLERDNLILSIAVIEAIQKNKARLIHCSSATSSLSKFAQVHLDPIRGTSALLWNTVIQELIEKHFFSRDEIAQMPGGKEFLEDSFDYSAEALEEKTGVEKDKILKAAKTIQNAKRIVFIHGTDRVSDRSPGDMVTLANFSLLLRSKGLHTELLFPALFSNLSGISLMGIEPGWKAFRVQDKRSSSPSSYQDLKALLAQGKIKGVLILGEDPMHDSTTSAYFQGLEFLGVIESGYTQTVKFADAVLPGTMYLESSGTRCDFTGKVKKYDAVLNPPSGKNTFEVLVQLATCLGLKGIPETIQEAQDYIQKSIQDSAVSPYQWVVSQRPIWDGKGKLVVASHEILPEHIVPCLTRMSVYKEEAKTVEIAYFKVH
ncbi:MAG: FAD-dependent oxidoreductase [Candidatus Brocadiae bacterium]|nr:FAD-dependent oxidoreductase [Candidatus Brocadiia bacterium]